MDPKVPIFKHIHKVKRLNARLLSEGSFGECGESVGGGFTEVLYDKIISSCIHSHLFSLLVVSTRKKGRQLSCTRSLE